MANPEEELEFWAQLASLPPFENLTEEQKASLVGDLQRIFFPWLNDPVAARQFFVEVLSPELRQGIEKDYQAGGMKPHLERTLSTLMSEGVPKILELLGGKKVLWPSWAFETQVALMLEGRVLLESGAVRQTRQHQEFSTQLAARLLAELLRFLRRKPFPFRRCRICKKVMVQAVRGKPKLYCSEVCRSKGIPFAAKRTEHVRERRREKRQEEIENVRRILQAWPEDEQWKMIHKVFPDKSRRALVQLVNKAKQQQQNETPVGKGV